MTFEHPRRDGSLSADPRLDRLRALDPRNARFPVRAVVPTARPRSYTWGCSTWLNQGASGGCVGHAFAHDLAARPAEHTLPGSAADNPVAYDVYWDAQRIDWWEGGAYPDAEPRMDGTSVLHGAKVCQANGWFDEYRWAFTVADLALAVGYKGPAVIGVNWHENMFQPDADGFISASGPVYGGHAILVRQVRLDSSLPGGGYFGLHNSWGNDSLWKLSFADMGRLLEAGGEACIPIRRRTHRDLPLWPT